MLVAWQQGDEKALESLIPLVYDELRRLARARLRREPRGHILQTTALVHEAYLRLVDINRTNVRDRSHLLAMAGRLMRRILVDHARRRTARKRGGRLTMVGLDELSIPNAESGIDVLALDEALNDLTRLDARLCRVVELKYFSGLTIDETAETLQVSSATVERDWTIAKAWLHQRLSTSPPTTPNQ
jgi:RNA polymerase sigma factor (TIGR02999 family)